MEEKICKICGKPIKGYPHNGSPLVDGEVGDCCNWKVIRERLRKLEESKKSKSAEEGISLDIPDGQVGGIVGEGKVENTQDPMADFEKYAKEFEETFILGDTPIRKEKAENKTKVVNGEVEGEVISLEKKEEELDQVEPVKSATEALHGFSEIFEFIRLCKEIGLNDYNLIQKFVEDNPGDPLKELRKFREDLGKEWVNRDLTEKERKELMKIRLEEIIAKAQGR